MTEDKITSPYVTGDVVAVSKQFVRKVENPVLELDKCISLCDAKLALHEAWLAGRGQALDKNFVLLLEQKRRFLDMLLRYGLGTKHRVEHSYAPENSGFKVIKDVKTHEEETKDEE